MHISWLGGTTIKIQAKPFDTDVIAVIDPYKPKAGNFPRSLTPDIAVFTRGEEGSVTLSGNPFILATAGECETKGILMSSVYADEHGNIFTRLDVEGVSVGHMGMASKQPGDKQLQVLSGVDVLLVPVGGEDCFDAQAAMKAVNTIEPRIVIPMAYKSDTDPKQADVSSFLKEAGVEPQREDKKVIIRKKDLPQEDMKVILVSKE